MRKRPIPARFWLPFRVRRGSLDDAPHPPCIDVQKDFGPLIKKYEVAAMPDPLPADLVEALSSIELATVGHLRHRGFVDRHIAAFTPQPKTLVGTAVTVSLPACDGTMLHYAISHLRAGDFLVIDRVGDDRYACVGGGVAARIAATGAVGVAVDGPCTDPGEMAEIDLGIWGRGVTALTTRISDLGGAFNVPVALGNVPVLPGDVVMGDNTGLIVLPRAEARDIYRAAAEREAAATAFLDLPPDDRPKSRAVAIVEQALSEAGS
ncbi:RraA family protein [Rhodobacteraceae bacterium CCMM004]|nr:RraA family protein [Rhodobacteraceae bacterium CCMM004]